MMILLNSKSEKVNNINFILSIKRDIYGKCYR